MDEARDVVFAAEARAQMRHIALIYERIDHREQQSGVAGFRLLKRKPGWKYEYWNGEAHISPGHRVVTMSLDIAPRSCQSPCRIGPVVTRREAELIAAYSAAFRDTIEYCDWEEERIADSANKSVVEFLAGERGDPLAASRLALVCHPEAEGRVVGGAALHRSQVREDACAPIAVASRLREREEENRHERVHSESGAVGARPGGAV